MAIVSDMLHYLSKVYIDKLMHKFLYIYDGMFE